MIVRTKFSRILQERIPEENLDEVVVTAMGISKEKKALGYAVQDVKADELTKGANTSLSGALLR